MFKEIRAIISKYLLIDYGSSYLGYLNENKYFSTDKCNIVTICPNQIWLLGIVDNETKNFRITPTINRDTPTIKYFIEKKWKRVNIL